jgi:hypothetical protein
MLPDAERRPGGGGVQDDDHGGGNVNVIVTEKWFGAVLYSRTITRRRIRTETDTCRGEFGPDGRWQPHCRGDAA